MTKIKKHPDESKQEDQPTSQTAIIEWQDAKENPPPYYRIISVKTRKGQVIDDCALIPDNVNGDFYISGYGRDIKDITHWKDFTWTFPTAIKKGTKI